MNKYNFQYPIQEDINLIIMIPSKGPLESCAVLHKEGCQHSNTKNVTRENVHVGKNPVFEADDWFYVAPCARVKGAKLNPLPYW